MLYIRNDWNLSVPISVSPTPALQADRQALSARLRSYDDILVRSTNASYFSDFTQTARTMLFTISEDGYDDETIPASVAALLSLASTYSVTTLAYNLEWPLHTWSEKLTRLIAVRAEFDNQSNALPIVFGPIYGEFYNYHAAAAPYCEGFGVQMQNSASEYGERSVALDAVSKAEGDMSNPIVQFQISCLSTNRSVESSAFGAAEVAGVAGVSTVGLYYGNSSNWSMCDQVLTRLGRV